MMVDYKPPRDLISKATVAAHKVTQSRTFGPHNPISGTRSPTKEKEKNPTRPQRPIENDHTTRKNKQKSRDIIMLGSGGGGRVCLISEQQFLLDPNNGWNGSFNKGRWVNDYIVRLNHLPTKTRECHVNWKPFHFNMMTSRSSINHSHLCVYIHTRFDARRLNKTLKQCLMYEIISKYIAAS